MGTEIRAMACSGEFHRSRHGGLRPVCCGSRRGWVISVDALLSTVILTLMLGTFAFLVSSSQPRGPVLLDLNGKAIDALDVLSHDGDLASLNASRVNSTLNRLVQANQEWSLTVDYYNYSSGNFTLSGNYSLGGNSSDKKTVSTETHLIPVINQTTGRAQYYLRAQLVLWPKE